MATRILAVVRFPASKLLLILRVTAPFFDLIQFPSVRRRA